jgi:FlaA1/EpsC-like NDP-sugar epimerase
MISTDKAIEPVSQLGATKRFAEMVAQAHDAAQGCTEGATPTRLIAVRFGNVLGSVGSVVPVFKAQIARGGPVTVTDPAMVRYFMTVREAADLVLTAASHADREARTATCTDGADQRAAVYVLKMGQPVRIGDLAERMIRLAGFEPWEDIEIVHTGSRPGERLNEILRARSSPTARSSTAGSPACTRRWRTTTGRRPKPCSARRFPTFAIALPRHPPPGRRPPGRWRTRTNLGNQRSRLVIEAWTLI